MTHEPPKGILARRDRRACPPVPFKGRILDESDLETVITLHRHAIAKARPDTVATETDAFFTNHMTRIGRILGLFAEGRLIAYGVLGLPGPGDANFGDMVHLGTADRARVAHIDGASVLPEWRGNRLHGVLIEWRLEAAVAAGRSIALSTAAPGNIPSVRNLLAAGMTIRALQQRFGGWRYILRRDLDRQPPSIPADGRWIDVDDLDAQHDLFRDGAIAWTLKTDGPSIQIWFASALQT